MLVGWVLGCLRNCSSSALSPRLLAFLVVIDCIFFFVSLFVARYIRLVDRAKDVIKSGGEWVSSADVENIIMSHSKVRWC